MRRLTIAVVIAVLAAANALALTCAHHPSPGGDAVTAHAHSTALTGVAAASRPGSTPHPRSVALWTGPPRVRRHDAWESREGRRRAAPDRPEPRRKCRAPRARSAETDEAG